MNCKQCGFEVIQGGRPADHSAQRRSYCSAGCQEVYETLKALAFRMEAA